MLVPQARLSRGAHEPERLQVACLCRRRACRAERIRLDVHKAPVGAMAGGNFGRSIRPPVYAGDDEYIGTFSLGAAIGESTGDCARDAFSTARRGLADDLQAVRRGHAASPRAEARRA